MIFARDLKVGDRLVSPKREGRVETVSKVDTKWGITFVWTVTPRSTPAADYAFNHGEAVMTEGEKS